MSDPSLPKAPGLRIATIGGVPVHLGWSWFLLAAVITVMFGAQLAEQTTWGYAIGIGYALVLLVAVLVHEGSHALAARSFGIAVHRVVADFLGGHTAFDARGLTAGRSASIAAAGPLANLTLAGLAWTAGGLVTGEVLELLLAGVAWINLLLAIFNLLPALPLDGGQLLEAAVWGATGRRSAGMVVAGWGGRVLTVAIAFWVLARPLLAGERPSTISVIWGLLLASVIWRGAGQAIAVGRLRGLMEGVPVGAVARPVTVVPPDTLVGDLPRTGLPVLATDATHRLLILSPPPGGVPADTPVSAVSVPVPAGAVIEAAPGADLWTVFPALQASGVGHAVVVDQGRVWGLVTVEEMGQVLARGRS